MARRKDVPILKWENLGFKQERMLWRCTQEALAEQLGTTRETVSLWQRGQRPSSGPLLVLMCPVLVPMHFRCYLIGYLKKAERTAHIV